MHKLNKLLASTAVSNQIAYNLHWNIKGEHFFTVHKMTEKLYEDLSGFVDDIAEKLVMIGETPLSTFNEYLKNSSVEEVKTKAFTYVEVSQIVIHFLNKLEKDALSVEGTHNIQPLLDEFFLFIDKSRWLFKSIV